MLASFVKRRAVDNSPPRCSAKMAELTFAVTVKIRLEFKGWKNTGQAFINAEG